MPATDRFATFADGIDDPAKHAVNVTTSDTADLAFASRFIRISVAGALHVAMVGGEDMTYPSGALAIGVAHRIRATRIYATGTAATGIVAEW